MSKFNETHVSFLLVITISLLFTPSSPSSDSSFVYGGCSQQKYDDGEPYESNLNSLLTSLVNSASMTPYNHFTVPNPTFYGLYQCRGDLSTADCFSCVRNAVSQLPHYCYHSRGATLQLGACHVRYGDDSFLGVPDTTLVLKKCGPSSVGFGADLIGRRDEVLAGLGSGSGSYRVGNVGYVSGMGQCLGDLSGDECTHCVSDAVERLRVGCGTGVWGDVYLAKCYVRYSAGGVYLSDMSSGARFLTLWSGWWGLPLAASVFSIY